MSAIHGCDKITEKINIKEERFILAHSFRGFHPWLLGSIVSWCYEAEHHGREYAVE
jgi:hypothetical protein